jgi:hypothetical protein
VENAKNRGFPNIRELTIAEATRVSGGGDEGPCADTCGSGPGCDCDDGDPPSTNLSFLLGKVVSGWLNPRCQCGCGESGCSCEQLPNLT